MSCSRQGNQLERIAVVRTLQHVKRLAEAEITQNVHGEIIAPVGHVLGHRPALALIGRPEADLLAKGAHVGQDVAFHLLHGAVAEAVAEHAPLASVQLLVARIVRVGRRVYKGVVEFGLAYVGLEAVNLLEGRVGVERDAIGPEAHDAAVPLVLAPELEMPVALPCVV